MASLHYTIDINAPKEKVWDTMLGSDTYRQWTAAFHAGSYYEGSWDKGSKIRFVSEEDGGKSGLLGVIVENIPYEFVSIETIAEIIDGREDTSSEMAQAMAGGHESYRFREQNGVTTLDVELQGDNMPSEITQMFDGMWPPSLDRLKAIAEQA